MSRYCFIFARGGSKGLPRKNIRELCGHPLIWYPINIAKQSGLFKDIIVSTDDQEIATIAKECGASVPFIRPKELAQDKSAERFAWQHAVKFVKEQDESFDTFVSLPCTAPLRTVETVKGCVELFEKNRDSMVLTCYESRDNPYFNMLKIQDNGSATLVCENSVYRRQDAPKVFNITPIAYVTSPEIVLKYNSLFDTKILPFIVSKNEGIDIDDIDDFYLAEYFMKKNYSAK